MNRAIYGDDWTLMAVCDCAKKAVNALMAGKAQLADAHKWGLVWHATHYDVDAEHYDRIRWHKEGHKYCQILWFLGNYGGIRFGRSELRDVASRFIRWIDTELNRDASHDDEMESYTLAELMDVITEDDIDKIPFIRGRLNA